MTRSTLTRVHIGAAIGGIAVITMFLVASAVTGLAGSAADIRVLRHGILLALPLLIGCLVTAAVTGRRLAGQSRSAIVRRKLRRLQAAAASGLLVLVPCAVILNQMAAGPAGGAFHGLETTEIVFGALNLGLLALNARDGRRMTRHRRPARAAVPVDTRPRLAD